MLDCKTIDLPLINGLPERADIYSKRVILACYSYKVTHPVCCLSHYNICCAAPANTRFFSLPHLQLCILTNQLIWRPVFLGTKHVYFDLAFTFLIAYDTFPEIIQLCHQSLSHHLFSASIPATHKLSDAVEAITMDLSSGQRCGKWSAIYFKLHFYRQPRSGGNNGKGVQSSSSDIMKRQQCLCDALFLSSLI